MRRKQQCLLGKIAAHDGATCQANHDMVGGTAFEDCCLACKLGLGIGLSNGVTDLAPLCKQVSSFYKVSGYRMILGLSSEALNLNVENVQYLNYQTSLSRSIRYLVIE